MPHTPITHDRLFHFWDLGWCTSVVTETFLNNHIQGQNRNIPMGLRVNIPLLKSTSCCFFHNFAAQKFQVEPQFFNFPQSLHMFHSQSFPSTPGPKLSHMKSYNWWKHIRVTSCETNYHLEPQIDSWFRSSIHLCIHCFSNKPCWRKKIPKSHKSFKRKQ